MFLWKWFKLPFGLSNLQHALRGRDVVSTIDTDALEQDQQCRQDQPSASPKLQAKNAATLQGALQASTESPELDYTDYTVDVCSPPSQPSRSFVAAKYDTKNNEDCEVGLQGLSPLGGPVPCLSMCLVGPEVPEDPMSPTSPPKDPPTCMMGMRNTSLQSVMVVSSTELHHGGVVTNNHNQNQNHDWIHNYNHNHNHNHNHIWNSKEPAVRVVSSASQGSALSDVEEDSLERLNLDTDLFSRELTETLQRRALAERLDELHAIRSVGTNTQDPQLREASDADRQRWYMMGQTRGCNDVAVLGMCAAL
jgi:hypothetical protein